MSADREAFRERLAQRMREDWPMLKRMSEYQPCPSRFLARVGFSTPTSIPCGLERGHDGDHTYTARWVDAEAGQ